MPINQKPSFVRGASGPTLLERLWRNRARQFAAEVSTGGRSHVELSKAAKLIQQDYHDRFLIELIQNANDQAVLANRTDSVVIVVLAERYIAVTNAGQAVTEINLERITSLADSNKNGLLIGNKGIGFKAVYQVTDAPEVYSASTSTDDTYPSCVFDDVNIGIAISRTPFDNTELVEYAENEIDDFITENVGLASGLKSRGFDNPLEAIRKEYRSAPGYMFPLRRDIAALKQHGLEEAIGEAYRKDVQTVVVLPFKDDIARSAAARTLSRLVDRRGAECAQAELAALFLPGVGTIVAVDANRGHRWIFSRTRDSGSSGDASVTISVSTPQGPDYRQSYWTRCGEVFDGISEKIESRRKVVERALEEFGLESWTIEDRIPVTIALPVPPADGPAAIPPTGRFSLGLPTNQATGLPAHMDGRFFASISRTEVDFAIPYNEMLLEVGTELLSGLLKRLRDSEKLQERRAATLALVRATGPLADAVYRGGGLADGPAVLAWDATTFLRRAECTLPNREEMELLPFLESVIAGRPESSRYLPERGLLHDSREALQAIGVSSFPKKAAHPWLLRRDEELCVLEEAARRNRDRGTKWWEPFVCRVLDGLDHTSLMDRAWLPTGSEGLEAPKKIVYIPATANSSGEDEEVSSVPPSVATTLRLLDGSVLPTRREDGRRLTDLALHLLDLGLVAQPRKKELLENALFPALYQIASIDESLAFDLLGQALVWIGSMKETSKNNLDVSNVCVPLDGEAGVTWGAAKEAYLGRGWGLSDDDDKSLEAAYPGRRLVSYKIMAERYAWNDSEVDFWRNAIGVLGVHDAPRVIAIESEDETAPLYSRQEKLFVRTGISLGNPSLDYLYKNYMDYVASFGTRWKDLFEHNVSELEWIDGLESDNSRNHVIDLILANKDRYLDHLETWLGRRPNGYDRKVPQFWAFAISHGEWAAIPCEIGRGGPPSRVSVGDLWLLNERSDSVPAYAKLLTVVPRRFEHAWPLLQRLGVRSLDDAPVDRLVRSLSHLALRIETDSLHTNRSAFSLALALYEQLERRLENEPYTQLQYGAVLPVLKGRRLEPLRPSQDATATIYFDDDPVRARHLPNLDDACRVPIGRGASTNNLYRAFVQTWGHGRVMQTSTAQVDLAFEPHSRFDEPFLDWLKRAFNAHPVAEELAALLTLGGEREVVDQVNQNWTRFALLRLEFGAFGSIRTTSYYDRQEGVLKVAQHLKKEDVIAATWEIAGRRLRDTWYGYARALAEGTSEEFLRDRCITSVEIVKVADAAGLHGAVGFDSLEAALIACQRHQFPEKTMEDAAVWWERAERTSQAIAIDLGNDELASVLERASREGFPHGDLLLIQHVGVPWSVWQEAVIRQRGSPYKFPETMRRYETVRKHLVAVFREIAVRDGNANLAELSKTVSTLSNLKISRERATLPIGDAQVDAEVLEQVTSTIGDYAAAATAFKSLPPLPWEDDLPIPPDPTSTKRGVRLFHEESSTRETESAETVNAVVAAAVLIAHREGETIDEPTLLASPLIRDRIRGEWAHVYGALLVLRDKLSLVAPRTVDRLTTVKAFRDPCNRTSLFARLPDLCDEKTKGSLQRKAILGEQMTSEELQYDLASGDGGRLGDLLAEAAARAPDLSFLDTERKALPPLPPGEKKRGKGRGRVGASGGNQREPEIVGDLGELFVHKWLSQKLGEEYGAECWVSNARERCGLPASGSDSFGYDFRVNDPTGRLFHQVAATCLIEVKSTSDEGARSFPMSSPEWEKAEECHLATASAIYVLFRVIDVFRNPRIGDIIIDPVAAAHKGWVRVDKKDLWITISPPAITPEE